MPITLNCPKCHKPFRVRDESIGGRVRCPSCGAVLQVPAALSPASHFGADQPVSLPPSTADRPLADDVPKSLPGGPPEVMHGGAGKRDDVIDFGPPGGTALPSPPSIKARPAPPAPPPPSVRAPAPAPIPARPPREERRREPVLLGAVPTEAPAWRRVAGGLGMIRWGLFFFCLILLGALGHGAWISLDYDQAMKDGPGFLGKEDWPRWKELVVAYAAIPAALGVLLLLVGRLRCGGAPAQANARGMALGAAFFTVVALLGIAVYVLITYFGDIVAKANLNLAPDLQKTIAETGLYAGIAAVVLADILTLLFVGQIGWPLGRPYLQRSVAGFFSYVILLPTAVVIGSLYYPLLSVIDKMREAHRLTGSYMAGGENDDVSQAALIWSVVLIAGVVMLLLRYAGVAGAGRKAIRKHLAGLA